MRSSVFRAAVCGVAAAVAVLSAHATVPAPDSDFPVSAEVKAEVRAQADAGNMAAQYRMMELDTDWTGEAPDFVDALHWAKRLRDKNEIGYYRGFIAEHARLYKEARSGDAKALYAFAQHVPHNAAGLAGDAPMAHWLKLAAQAGSVAAQADIGRLYFRAAYLRATGVQATPEARRENRIPWYLDATAPAGPIEPLGFDDESAQTDLPNAILWLGKAADAGNARAQYDLGLAYAAPGPTHDDAKARLWLHRALVTAPGGTEPAACRLDFAGSLGLMPTDGGMFIAIDSQPDYAAALACYNAARHGDGDAQFMTGYMAHHGLGAPRDDTRAWVLLEQTARGIQSDSDAIEAKYELSRLYLDSTTLPRDPVRSYILLSEAIDEVNKSHSGCAPMQPRHVPPTGSLMYATSDTQAKEYAALGKDAQAIVDSYLRQEGIASHNPGPPQVPYPPMPCM